MEFRVVESSLPGSRSLPDTIYLAPDAWDDWFSFQSRFNVYYVDPGGVRRRLGFTKIGRFGLKSARETDDVREGFRRPDPPREFETLPEDFFSLGQDASFYENLGNIGDDFRERVLIALRDLAYDPGLLARAATEEVTKISLLRDIPIPTVKGQFARIARGGAPLTPYRFSYKTKGLSIGFAVEPNSKPPTNIHVLVGRNGVGKSTMLDRMAKAFVYAARKNADSRSDEAGSNPGLSVSNVVSVSFSAFDVFEPITVPRDRTKGMGYHYVGLKKVNPKKEEALIKDSPALSREMTISAKGCLQGSGRLRWLRAIRLLEGDPIFGRIGLADLAAADEEEFFSDLPEIFRKLSSGHKIILLTITRLVETVVEKTVVLIDEPEAHLHPPLLSAFVRALSDLLTNRNGLAIIATHSPVVLQEVPRSCAWRLQRIGDELSAERLERETFGENVGTLTDEVFGLEVTGTGFHKMLSDLAQEHATYEDALAELGGQLGAEGRAILRAKMAALRLRDADVAR